VLRTFIGWRSTMEIAITIARLIPALAIALLVHLTAGVATAARFEAFAETFLPIFSGPPCFESSSGPVTCQSSSDRTAPPPASVDARAAASTTLGVFGSIDLGGVGGGRAESSALMGFNDMIITSTNPFAEFVVGAVNLDVHGIFTSSLAVAPIPGSSATTSASALVEVSVESPFGGLPFRRGRLDFSHSVSAGQTTGPSLTQDGDFSGNFNIPPGTSSFLFESLPFLMPVGRPFLVEVFLRGDITTSLTGQGTAHGGFNFQNTLTFPALRSVITLPEGYTLNSVEAQIVDNRWVGGEPASVPEPGTLSLLGLAAVGAILAPRRRMRR
jgi:hypothetical protein